MGGGAMGGSAMGGSAMGHALLPPARQARRIAFVLSVVAVGFALGFGYCARRTFVLREAELDVVMPWLLTTFVLLLVAMLLRMGGAIGELLWLERTWSNLPESLRRVGPIRDVNSAMLLGISFVPGIAWMWKLGLVIGVADGFTAVRAHVRFTATVPKRLGIAAVVVGWLPGLNVYVAPFLWEVFARRIDECVEQIMAQRQLEPKG